MNNLSLSDMPDEIVRHIASFFAAGDVIMYMMRLGNYRFIPMVPLQYIIRKLGKCNFVDWVFKTWSCEKYKYRNHIRTALAINKDFENLQRFPKKPSFFVDIFRVVARQGMSQSVNTILTWWEDYTKERGLSLISIPKMKVVTQAAGCTGDRSVMARVIYAVTGDRRALDIGANLFDDDNRTPWMLGLVDHGNTEMFVENYERLYGNWSQTKRWIPAAVLMARVIQWGMDDVFNYLLPQLRESSKWIQIVTALRLNRIEMCENLLKASSPPDSDEVKYALKMACFSGKTETFDWAWKQLGHHISLKEIHQSLLKYAAKSGSLKMVQYIVDLDPLLQHVNLNSVMCGGISMRNFTEIIPLLIKLGATDLNGALLSAINTRRILSARMLYDMGARVPVDHIQTIINNRKTFSMYNGAGFNGNLPMLVQLIRWGCSTDVQADERTGNIIELAKKYSRCTTLVPERGKAICYDEWELTE